MCFIPDKVDGSMLSLAKEWNIGRKSVCRLLEDFSQRGLIRVASNPVTSIIYMVCVKSWMIDGQLTENPTYRQAVKAYEGVRIYLFNGQRLETLRKSSARTKKPKDKDTNKDKEKPAQASQPNQSISEDNEQSKQPENNPPLIQEDALPDGNTSYK